ncbi:hypothetical protein [Bradyrhizobium sp. 33ap4]|uniref:hypothetical protein n=1 Tax=Bradyrhizobium sp. 33ap4 TaxID=3061630 RepID=UPI00292F9728|nr:hypothetical protein [Bradyrhizobium sp. 33ap4]
MPWPVYTPASFYDPSIEHESLRAVMRCYMVNFGWDEALRRRDELLGYFKVKAWNDMSPFGANVCRKIIERQLPLRGDF